MTSGRRPKDLAYISWNGRTWTFDKLNEAGHRQCIKCKEIKPLDNFYTWHSGKSAGRVHSMCKPCLKAYRNQWRKDNLEAHVAYGRRWRTGAPDGTYDFLVSQQGRVCAICGTDKPGGQGSVNGFFHLDHDGKTGVIRGLLCNHCNLGLGLFKHDKALLMAAVAYLRLSGYTIQELERLCNALENS